RPEWLEATTHTWLRDNGFPRGIVHTTLGLTGALGGAALTFKTDEMAALRARFGVAPEIGIGNTDSDAAAYAGQGVRSRFLYRFSGDLMGGTLVEDYNALAASLRGLPALCL
ncbi:MAG: phosphatidylinositol transfer protein, partial [Polyangiales bacterium]